MSRTKPISQRTFDVLRAIQTLKSADRRDVADFLKVEREFVSPVFTRLECNGYIERLGATVHGLAAKHANKVAFKVTKKGAAALKKSSDTSESSKPREMNIYAKARPSDPAVAQPRDQFSVMYRPVYVPPPSVNARPGADDHKQFKSKGTI